MAVGFDVILLEDAIYALNQDSDDGTKAFSEMRRQGAAAMKFPEIAR